ncbi:mitochondrial ribosomal protein S18 precursor, putative [Plasmodium berghei]|uniref:Mitochondrial ribosomal protein S18, putative n=2 Tax=Plasmodium berghei TaxID=5821 RepID=A0A509AHC2_PLABA|nr:mitochondrial ribosomal protein S18 precursor, putative [Plasmodium berghei ANKA]CXI17514.1 mitochondrial ribosomal protein S18 precursor, putative [Plasmodium berghei]SCM19705.1 mitochondrial ribosomal protein S18 precursor, putative [Plasmodium berghei]SCN23451.1 mitochondrial ribosomal protein S18 precursor, putative [Plasmodium berghei]SCO59087.1 mitochondrial ribosomal protein S18 precursor, putative [Plasmodium berghei]SCO59738.1 mitochondrial ribosomal protein S18 precursor, putative|eukprot:XP_034420600.1 mitochondrial ribosomal protein S18 precursor, putative [Plasmodium berghei ANKA]
MLLKKNLSLKWLSTYFGKTNRMALPLRFLSSNDVKKIRYNKINNDELCKIEKYKLNEQVEEVKVSKEICSNALFNECLEELYKMKKKVDSNSVEYDNSPVIDELNKEELKITRNIFERINKKKKHVSNLSYKDIYIDPYWNPFKEVNDLKKEITYEFNEYSKLANIIELKKQKRAIKKSLKEQYKLYNPYSDKYNNECNTNDFDNNDKSEKYWNPSFDKRKILNIKTPFIWRHTHLLHNFIGENGLILPRKINYTTRKQQIQIFKSICIARRMALYPYDRKPALDELIPIMDPMQLLVDELTHRYKQNKDLRAQALLKVMINKYPLLNFYKYFCFEANKQKQSQQPHEYNDIFKNELASSKMNNEQDQSPIKSEQKKQENFSKMLEKYKKNYYENSFNY